MGLMRCRNYSMAARLLLIRDDDGSSTVFQDSTTDDGRREKLPGCATGCADIPKASIPQPLSCDATCGDGICVASTFST